MDGLIYIGILILIAVLFPPLALFIIPFIIVSVLVGFCMRSVAGTLTEPIRDGMGQSAERIAQSIERRNAEAWASQYDDVEINEDGNLRVIRVIDEEEPETDCNVVKTPTPKKTTKKKKPRAKKAKKDKKEEKLPTANDLIKDIENELFGDA